MYKMWCKNTINSGHEPFSFRVEQYPVIPLDNHLQFLLWFPLNMQIINDDNKLCDKLTKSYHIHHINCIFNWRCIHEGSETVWKYAIDF